MPKRKIPDSLLPRGQEKAALAAIKKALKHPHHLTEEEEREFLARRAHGAIEQHEYVVTERRGRPVYREPGKGGADLSVPPYYWQMLKRRRDFEAECAKVDRAIATTFRNREHRTDMAAARSAGAQVRRDAVITKFHELIHMAVHNRASKIAADLDMPVRTVREMLRGASLIGKHTKAAKHRK